MEEEARRMAAALSRIGGTFWSSCSVVLERRGVRCGFVGCGGDDDVGRDHGSMSRSNMADEEECLKTQV